MKWMRWEIWDSSSVACDPMSAVCHEARASRSVEEVVVCD
jgi:hypothetical protein